MHYQSLQLKNIQKKQKKSHQVYKAYSSPFCSVYRKQDFAFKVLQLVTFSLEQVIIKF